MKKFLSLVLALVMVMSLVTVSAGAKDFTDDDKITYEEAVSVISEIGVVDGDTNGAFRPTDTLTRQAAAKIICNLILGPTTAAELHADTAPYKDVAVNNQFAGYIAYCQSRGIISGYADGSFRPTGTLTGYAFMKMLLGALGYDSSLEGYVGSNWSINVAKQALGIGLNKGLEGEFNGIKAVTREEAALYAFRTLQSDLVEYGQRLTTSVNGTEVTLSAGGAKSREWNSQQSRYDNIRADNLIQFAEEYFNKLEKKKDTDEFERPSYTWIYDKNEIGTYVDWELMVEEYTEEVTGRDLYDLLGTATIRDNDLIYYVNGVTPGAVAVNAAASANIQKKDLVRSNDKGVGVTDNGVLTQVFLDKDADLLTIVSINTWLAQATNDYSESKEYAPLNVFLTNADGRSFNVDVEDVANVVDVKDEDFYLVNISYKSNTNGDVVTISTPEIMEDSTVTKFSTTNSAVTGYPTKLTTGGTEYKKSARAYYDAESLETYYDSLLTNITYTIYMDQYGYFIGVEIYEGEKNYVFITGFDRINSNLSVKTADAVGIFLDGTMDQFKVNVTDTDKNIESVAYSNGAPKNVADRSGTGSGYFVKWTDSTWLPRMYGNNTNGVYNINRWFTYTVNDNGVYTLKPCTRMNAEFFGTATTIKTARVNISDNVLGVRTPKSPDANVGFPYTINTRSYGNDDSVYLTVDLDEVDNTSGYKRAITEVNGVYTGVQNVEIEIDTKSANIADQQAQVYTVYDKNNFVIGAVVIGEGNGSNANIVYRLSGTKSEELKDGTYYWEFDAFDGEKKTLTVKSKSTMLRDQINTDSDAIMKLRYDADGYVVGYNDISDLYTNYTVNNADDMDVYKIIDTSTVLGTLKDGTTITCRANKLTQEGNTLYVTAAQNDVGLALRPDAKALTIQVENGSTEKTAFTSVKSALGHLADLDELTEGLQYSGDVVAALDGSGAALWVVFRNNTELKTGNNPNYGTGRIRISHSPYGGIISVQGPAATTASDAMTAILNQLRSEGYEITWSSITGNNLQIWARRDGVTVNFAYNHAYTNVGGNFTADETVAYDKAQVELNKLDDSKADFTKLQVSGTKADGSGYTTSTADESALKSSVEEAVKKALGGDENVEIIVGTPDITTPVTQGAPGNEAAQKGTNGEARVPVTIKDKATGATKTVYVKVTLAAKAYSASSTASNLGAAKLALENLPLVLAGRETPYDETAFKTEVARLAGNLITEAVGANKVSVAVAIKANTSFDPAVNATDAEESSLHDGDATVTITLTEDASSVSETVEKAFELKGLPYAKTQAGIDAAAVAAITVGSGALAEDAADIADITDSWMTMPVGMRVSADGKVTGSVVMPATQKNFTGSPWYYRAEDGNTDNSFLVIINLKAPEGAVKAVRQGHPSNKDYAIAANSEGLTVAVLVPYTGTTGGTTTISFKWYREGDVEMGTSNFTIDASGVTVTKAAS